MRSRLLLVLGATLIWVAAASTVYANEAAPVPEGEPAAAVDEIATDAAPAPAAEEAAAPVEPADAAAAMEPAPAADDAVEAEVAADSEAPMEAEVTADADAPMEAEVTADADVPMEAEIAADADAAMEAEGDAAEAAPAEMGEVEVAEPTPAVTLGQIGYDDQGRQGRIHIVVVGDTLWDISDAYLGTPWVWPSIWTDNENIENPHLIYPGDRIWITASEMRRVSEEEAARLLAGQPAEEDVPAAAADDATEVVPEEEAPKVVRVSSLESTGLVTAQQLESSASIVDGVPNRVMLVQKDQVYIGYGKDEVSVGDEFTAFRTMEKVFDPDTGRLLGYHVDILGWIEIDEVNSETALGTIRMSATEMQVGDRVMPREKPVLDIEVGESPVGVEGRISFFPSNRVLMGMIDYVYLNRGELDGLHVGSPLEVYRPGWRAPERARNTRVEVPDRAIAQLLVVKARPETSVALVTHTETELELGDQFRGIQPGE